MITAILIFVTLMALLGAPVFIVLSAYAITGFLFADKIPLPAMTVDVYNNFANNPLLYTIPLFTFSGFILSESQTSKRMVDVFRAFLGFVPGGVALVALICCSFFTAFTGASGVTIVALGGLLFPAMIKEKYPEDFSLGLLTTSGSLGLLFAPCLPLIMYAVVSGASITQVFVAGIIPGVLLIVLMGIYSAIVAVKAKVPRSKTSLPVIWKAVYVAKWELAIPFIILGGLIAGFVTIGEVATLTAAYALVIEVFVYKDIPLNKLFSIMAKSIALTGAMLIIMGAAYGLTNYMVDAEVPLKILLFIRKFIHSKFMFLVLLNLFLLIVGCLLDIYTAIFVMVPLLIPIANSYQINLVHLGIIFLANLEIGYMTPPVGMNLFIASLRFDRPMLSLVKASLPFILILLFGLALMTYLPALSLGLIDVFHIS